MDPKELLYGLIATTREQQAAIQSALDGLAQERAALSEAAHSAGAGAAVAGRAAQGAIAAAVQAAEGAVAASVAQSMAGAGQKAADALGEASRPIVGELAGVVQAAKDAEGKLAGAVAAFGWRWAMVVGLVVFFGIAALAAVAWASVWWQRSQVDDLVAQRRALSADVAELRENVAKLEKKGGRIVMTQCGGRLCIEASDNQGKNQDGSPTELGGWGRDEQGRRVKLVIPRGY